SGYNGGDAICRAADGTLVSLKDPKCPEDIRKALRRAGPQGNGVASAISQDEYNMKHGLDANGQ
ncbi:MAG: hypothetical protein ACTHOR_09350, partial [Devosia sp.]